MTKKKEPRLRSREWFDIPGDPSEQLDILNAIQIMESVRQNYVQANQLSVLLKQVVT